MMKKILTVAAALCGSMAFASTDTAANTFVVDFDTTSDYWIFPTYGSVNGEFSAWTTEISGGGNGQLRLGTTGFGDLTNVVFSDRDRYEINGPQF